MALLYLIELLILEFKVSGDLALIAEIEKYISNGYEFTKMVSNHKMRLELIILHSNLKFLKLEFDNAINDLKKAKNSCKKYC